MMKDQSGGVAEIALQTLEGFFVPHKPTLLLFSACMVSFCRFARVVESSQARCFVGTHFTGRMSLLALVIRPRKGDVRFEFSTGCTLFHNSIVSYFEQDVN